MNDPWKISGKLSKSEIEESVEEFKKFMGYYDFHSKDFMTEADHETLLEIRASCMHQVDALLLAGWKYELPEIVNRKEFDKPGMWDTEPWQWYWRRPPRKKNSNGKRYLSTQQAFNALQKEKQ